MPQHVFKMYDYAAMKKFLEDYFQTQNPSTGKDRTDTQSIDNRLLYIIYRSENELFLDEDAPTENFNLTRIFGYGLLMQKDWLIEYFQPMNHKHPQARVMIIKKAGKSAKGILSSFFPNIEKIKKQIEIDEQLESE